MKLMLLCPLLFLSMAGCTTTCYGPTSPGGVRAPHVTSPMRIDGTLDEAVWQTAPRYRLVRGKDRRERRPDYQPEAGRAQIAWDQQHLYVAATLEDDDLITRDERGSKYYMQLGDTFEIFLKPIEQTDYWEIHVTPGSRHTLLHIGSVGWLGLAGNMRELESALDVAVVADGTIRSEVGDPGDEDKGWTVEIAIPMAALRGVGAQPLEPGRQWDILIGRYNFGRRRVARGAEVTSYPRLTRSSFHDNWEYAPLILER